VIVSDPAIVGAVESLMVRVMAATVLSVLVAAGSWVAGKQARDSAQRVDALRDGRAIQGQVLEEASAIEAREMLAYEAAVIEDARAFDLDPPDLKALTAPNVHVIALSEAVILRPGESWSSSHLVVRAKQEKVTYQKNRGSIAAPHVVAEIENVAGVPIAYHVRVRSHERGRCEVRGTRSHNAVALQPAQKASIVVCAGRGALSLEHVEALELTPFGYHLVSGLPPLALGIDPVTAQAHRPPPMVPSCEAIDARGHAAEIEGGRARWVDVVDFYSRHHCTRWQYVSGYRHATGRLTPLPVTQKSVAAAAAAP
jgi:hypothetical protein